MAQIYKRNNKWAFKVSWYDQEKKRHWSSKSGFNTKREATAAATKVENKKVTIGLSNQENISLTDYYQNWIETYKLGRIKHGTELPYIRTGKYLEDWFGDTPLKNVTRSEYQKFIDHYAATHVREVTVRLNSFVRKSVQYAIDDGIIYKDFTLDVNIPAGKKSKSSSLKYLELDEAEKLKKSCIEKANFNGVNYYLILAGLLTGARIGELLALSWDNIDFKNKTIQIKHSFDYQFTHQVSDTKTESSKRTIIVDDELLKMLAQLKAEQATYFLSTGYRDHENLVFRNKLFKISSPMAANKLLHKLLIEINAKNQISFHGLRHTHASILIAKGVSIDYIAERLGHSTPRTTLNVYSHLLDSRRKADDTKVTQILKNL